MMSTEWYYATDGQQHGPVTSADLKGLAASGTITPGSLTWKEGLPEWVSASTATSLFAATPPKLPPASVAWEKSFSLSAKRRGQIFLAVITLVVATVGVWFIKKKRNECGNILLAVRIEVSFWSPFPRSTQMC